MKYNSIKTNYAFNLVDTILGAIFPLITFPYVTRVLTPEGIGQVQFFTTVIEYVILVTSLGIPLYAVREIAKYRDNEFARNQQTLEILLLHFFLSFIGYLIVFILAVSIPEIKGNKSLFLLLSLGVFFNTIGVQWFYQGIEDFKYITYRSIFVKFTCLIFLFIFVRDRKDLLEYGFVQLGGTAGNYIFNFFKIKKIF